MFKVKIKGKDETSYYKVYDVVKEKNYFATHIHGEYITKFLIHDFKNGFHWVNANLCEPV
jgi:hypothetical protein